MRHSMVLMQSSYSHPCSYSCRAAMCGIEALALSLLVHGRAGCGTDYAYTCIFHYNFVQQSNDHSLAIPPCDLATAMSWGITSPSIEWDHVSIRFHLILFFPLDMFWSVLSSSVPSCLVLLYSLLFLFDLTYRVVSCCYSFLFVVICCYSFLFVVIYSYSFLFVLIYSYLLLFVVIRSCLFLFVLIRSYSFLFVLIRSCLSLFALPCCHSKSAVSSMR